MKVGLKEEEFGRHCCVWEWSGEGSEGCFPGIVDGSLALTETHPYKEKTNRGVLGERSADRREQLRCGTDPGKISRNGLPFLFFTFSFFFPAGTIFLSSDAASGS